MRCWTIAPGSPARAALMACAARGDVEGAVMLMAHGARPSQHTKRHSRYPLNFAATQRFLFLMRVLLGRPPEGMTVTATTLRALKVPGATPGMPASLLLRRPDIRNAEAQL